MLNGKCQLLNKNCQLLIFLSIVNSYKSNVRANILKFIRRKIIIYIDCIRLFLPFIPGNQIDLDSISIDVDIDRYCTVYFGNGSVIFVRLLNTTMGLQRSFNIFLPVQCPCWIYRYWPTMLTVKVYSIAMYSMSQYYPVESIYLYWTQDLLLSQINSI